MISNRSLPRWIVPTLALSLVITLVAAGALLWPRSEPIPTLGQMPAFSLTNQSGQIVKSTDLKGKLLVVSLIYTSCPDICPITTSKIRSLQDELAQTGRIGKDVWLLSITVDPERDTPSVLAEYAKRYDADLGSWHFLTGDLQYIRNVVVTGFMLGFEKVDGGHQHTGSAAASYEVMHSDRVVIVDRTGAMRSIFRTEDFSVPLVIKLLDSLK